MLTGRRNWITAVFGLFVAPASMNSAGPMPEATASTKAVKPTSSSGSHKCEYHVPPPGVQYDDNPSVFGAILRGEEPALILAENESLLAFRDRTPRAPLHALVIPKTYIPSVFELEPSDLPWVEEMHSMAVTLIQESYPEALERMDYILCYHVPPFNSVDHLHLHVLAPASEMSWPYRYGKYLAGSRWCTGGETLISRLRQGKKAVPYR